MQAAHQIEPAESRDGRYGPQRTRISPFDASNHIGPWKRLLLGNREIPADMFETYVCNGNTTNCPGHLAASIENNQARLELLTARTGYLEEHHLRSLREWDALRKKIRRHEGVGAAIHVIPGEDIRAISSVAVGGRYLDGPARVDYVNELVERAPRREKKRSVTFMRDWPKADGEPQRYFVVGRNPDEPKVAESPSELSSKTDKILKSMGVSSEQQMSFRGGNGTLTRRFHVPPEIAENPLLFARFLGKLGYHSVDPRFFGWAATVAKGQKKKKKKKKPKKGKSPKG